MPSCHQVLTVQVSQRLLATGLKAVAETGPVRGPTRAQKRATHAHRGISTGQMPRYPSPPSTRGCLDHDVVMHFPLEVRL